MQTRLATPDDAPAIAAIYNEGIEDRIATFETRPRTPDDIRAWFADAAHPVVVVTEGDQVIAYATTSTYRPRDCYAGIAEFGVYVGRAWRGKGAGKAALLALFDAAEANGYWKLVSRIFVENAASRALMRSVGFREVGVYEKHGQLDGVWRDCVIVEKLLNPATPKL
jgi:phosphinothricin acetyltransferase